MSHGASGQGVDRLPHCRLSQSATALGQNRTEVPIDDSARTGFPDWQVNHITVQLVAALFGQGAGVVFGHDWRDNGVMEAVHAFARNMQSSISAGKQKEDQLLCNVLPWPDEPKLTQTEQQQLSSTLRIERAGLPTEVERYAAEANTNQQLYAYLRSRGLTHLRWRLSEMSEARLCLGGRMSSFQGRYPGIIEETLIAVHAKKPIFLVGLLGGATTQVIAALRGEGPRGVFQTLPDVRAAYERPPIPESDERTHGDRTFNEAEVWESFRRVGIEGIAARNKFSVEENLELFQTPVFDRIVTLLLIGLARLRTNGTATTPLRPTLTSD